MKKVIIGIAGVANSGKDTVASMINYINHVGVTKASYSNWLTHQKYYDFNLKHRIIHFADPLKDCLSIMYGIPREYFDDRDKKDKEYFLIHEGRFVDEETFKAKYHEIDFHALKDFTLNKILDDALVNVGIKLRTLMQYFGTNVCRDMMGDNIWIRAAMSRAVDIVEEHDLCIFPDVRFSNEAISIMNHSFYGGVIKVNRDSCKKTDHPSEDIDFECSIEVDNNGTKMQLFYKVLEIYKQLIK